MKQRGRRRTDGVEDGGGDGGRESATAEETPVKQRRRLPVAPAHPQIGLGFFGGFGGAQVNLVPCAAGLHLSL